MLPTGYRLICEGDHRRFLRIVLMLRFLGSSTEHAESSRTSIHGRESVPGQTEMANFRNESMGSTSEFGRRGIAVASVDQARARSPAAKPPASAGSGIAHIRWLLFGFEGRIPRLHYWLGQIGIVIVSRFMAFLLYVLSDSWITSTAAHSDPLKVDLLVFIVSLLMILGTLVLLVWVALALVVKRWHDRGKSWAWALPGFIPLVGWAWQGIECGFLEGTLGPNRFGPSPKGIGA